MAINSIEEHYEEELADSTGITSGVEKENIEAELETQPFDPLKLSLFSKPMTASDCIRRIKQGTIDLSPDFQRNEVWDKVRKSRLIESLMLKIPLPMFYVASDELENYQVVDGLQRLSTLRDFVIGKKDKEPFALESLEFWSNYNGYTFNQLPPHLQNRITEATFTFTIINPGTPERAKRDVFKRINTGGLTLTDQEIRHALYTGKSTELLNLLAGSEDFIKATDGSIRDNRMAGRELILRFISFIIREPKDYRSYSMDEWLSHTMQIVNLFGNNLSETELIKILNEINSPDFVCPEIQVQNIDEIVDLFSRGMQRSWMLFNEYSFRKSLPGYRRSPINKGLFEVWSTLLGKMKESDFKNILKKREVLLKTLRKLYQDEKFFRSISRDSHKAASVEYRYRVMNETIKKILET